MNATDLFGGVKRKMCFSFIHPFFHSNSITYPYTIYLMDVVQHQRHHFPYNTIFLLSIQSYSVPSKFAHIYCSFRGRIGIETGDAR